MFDKEEIVSAHIEGDGNVIIQNSDNTIITIDTNNIIELRKQIENSGANEFGLYPYSGTDAKRLELEGDLIDTNNPPCNG